MGRHQIKVTARLPRRHLGPQQADLAPQALNAYWSANHSAIQPMGAGLINPLGQFIGSISANQDIDALDAARDEIVRMVDASISSLSGVPVRPLLEDLIAKVKDAKLSTLLREFNAVKDHQPNIAAKGLRTIICLVIQEKAKLTQPEGALAKTQDLMLKPMLRGAIEDKIFSEGETKLLKAFERQGLKETFDNSQARQRRTYQDGRFVVTRTEHRKQASRGHRLDRPTAPRGSGAGASSRSWAAASTGRRSEASSGLAWRGYLGGLPHLAASRRTDSAG